MATDEFSADTPELAMCVQVNLENVERLNPALKAHPIYALAKRQLDAVVARLNGEAQP